MRMSDTDVRGPGLEEELRALRDWKASALEVLGDLQLQEVAKVLDIQLGERIARQVLPKITELKGEATLAERQRILEILYPLTRSRLIGAPLLKQLLDEIAEGKR